MKTQLIILLVLMLGISAKAQETFHISVGGTLSYINKKTAVFGQNAGYYLGVSTKKSLTDHVKTSGELQFIDQKSTIDNFTYKSNSINFAALFNFYPAQKGFSINTGIQIGALISSSAYRDGSKPSKGKMNFIAGLSYEVERIDFHARYLHSVGGEMFDSMIQAGIGYRLN